MRRQERANQLRMQARSPVSWDLRSSQLTEPVNRGLPSRFGVRRGAHPLRRTLASSQKHLQRPQTVASGSFAANHHDLGASTYDLLQQSLGGSCRFDLLPPKLGVPASTTPMLVKPELAPPVVPPPGFLTTPSPRPATVVVPPTFPSSSPPSSAQSPTSNQWAFRRLGVLLWAWTEA